MAAFGGHPNLEFTELLALVRQHMFGNGSAGGGSLEGMLDLVIKNSPVSTLPE